MLLPGSTFILFLIQNVVNLATTSPFMGPEKYIHEEKKLKNKFIPILGALKKVIFYFFCFCLGLSMFYFSSKKKQTQNKPLYGFQDYI